MSVPQAHSGFRHVKRFWPEAKTTGNGFPHPKVIEALDEIGGLEFPTKADIVRVFDKYAVGVWGGTIIDVR